MVGVHNALMPDGRVLAYDSVGDNATETYPVHDHTRATLWDPATGTQTPVWVDTGYNVFCSGLASGLLGMLVAIMHPMLTAMDGRGFQSFMKGFLRYAGHSWGKVFNYLWSIGMFISRSSRSSCCGTTPARSRSCSPRS